MIPSAGTKVALICMVVAVVVGCGEKTMSDSIASARTSIAKRDYATAVIELKSALQQAPNSGEARYLLGVALLEQRNPSAALLELGKARDQNFNDELVAPKLARALVATNKWNEVVQAYADTTLKDASSQSELATAVAVAQLRLNRREEANAAIAKALAADPKYPWGLLTKARILATDGKVDDALALIDQAIRPGSPSGDAYMLRGALLRIAKRNVDDAIKAYQQAAADPQETLDARTALIEVYLSQQKLAEAKAQLAELSKSHAQNPQTMFLDAKLAYAGKDYARAESITAQLLRVAPNNPQLLVLGGAANLQHGSLIAAEAKLGKVVQTVERPVAARKLLAETYLRMGQPEKALAALNPLLEAKPDGDALALAGHAHLQSGNAQEAEAMFAAAVKLKPQDVQARTALALTNLAKGNAGAAFDALQDIAVKDAGETADLALISAHLRRREYDAALVAIALLEKKLPNKPTAAHFRGLALRGKGDGIGARAAFEAALKVEPRYFASIAALASLDQQEKKPDEARKRLDAAIKLDPKNTAARMALLDLMARQQVKPAEILSAIDDAIKASPDDGALRVARIAQLSRMSDVKAAASAAQDAMAALPQHPDVLDAAGRALANAGDVQQALSAFNRLAAVMPRSALPYLRLADLHAKRGDAASVVSSLNRAFEAAPESPEVHRRMLSQAVRSKDFRPALAAAKQLQKRLPQSAAGFLLEGDVEAARKAWSAAIAAYRGALRKSDAEARPQKLVYIALRASGDKASAERFSGDWLKENPKDAHFLEHLGSEAILQGNYAKAEKYFRDVVALQPRDRAAMNNLAWLMAHRGAKGAVDLAEQALALAPTAAPVMDTLAKALAAEGQLDRAIEVQKKALEATPNQQAYRLNLARLYVKADRKVEANAELQVLAKLGDKFVFQAEVAGLRKALGK